MSRSQPRVMTSGSRRNERERFSGTTSSLGNGELSLVGREVGDGDGRRAEVVDPGGRTLLPDEALATLTLARTQAQQQAEQALDDAVIHVALGQANPDRDVNLSQTAEDLGVARNTLKARVKKVAVAPA